MPQYLMLSNDSRYIVLPDGTVKEFYIDNSLSNKARRKARREKKAKEHAEKLMKKYPAHYAKYIQNIEKRQAKVHHTVLGKAIHSKAAKTIGGIVAGVALTVGSTLIANPELGIAADAAIIGAETAGEAAAAATGEVVADTAVVAAEEAAEGAAVEAASVAAESGAEVATEESAETVAEQAANKEAEAAAKKAALKSEVKESFEEESSNVVGNNNKQQQQQPNSNKQASIAAYIANLQSQYNAELAQLPPSLQSSYKSQFQNFYQTQVVPAIQQFLNS